VVTNTFKIIQFIGVRVVMVTSTITPDVLLRTFIAGQKGAIERLI
jgi:hypothetical protein